jgi:hypothetical protein
LPNGVFKMPSEKSKEVARKLAEKKENKKG